MRIRTVLLGSFVLLLAGSVVFAGGRNRDRGLDVTATTLDSIGICNPEDDATVAEGWDLDPTLGGWGNKDETEFAVVWEPGTMDVPANAGRFAECTIPGLTGKTPRKIKMNVLEGLANDDYCLFASIGAGDLLIACVNEASSGENWVTKEFALPAGAFSSGQDVTVKILVTANDWPSFSTWGQLGVDWIEVLGD